MTARKREEKILHPLDQSSKGHNGQDWGRPKLGAWDPTLVSHVSYKGLSTSFPDAIPGSWVANASPGTRKCIHKDCSSYRQLLTMSSSCHNPGLDCLKFKKLHDKLPKIMIYEKRVEDNIWHEREIYYYIIISSITIRKLKYRWVGRGIYPLFI